ncbi:MAG: hypothetical protein ACR2PM_12830 [Hyphomicrobiales bacterium]
MYRLPGVILLLAASLLGPGVAAAGEWRAGGYAFSDELGGFEILGASGAGTRTDPIVIVERIDRLGPAVLVIRPLARAGDDGRVLLGSFVQFSLVTVVTNGTRRNWAGFDLELQEEIGQPSVYVDGLSFDQLGTFDDRVFTSDRFALFTDLTEPFDRIRFERGYVVPKATVRFQVYITDVTPKAEFYLVQEPQLLVAEWPAPGGWRHAKAAE